VALEQGNLAGHDPSNGEPDSFRERTTQDTLRGWVEVNDAVLRVQDDHSVTHALDDDVTCHRHETQRPMAEKRPREGHTRYGES
jgi:hypothetical protein